jgi:hypothetical protein
VPAYRPLGPWTHRMWAVVRRHPDWNLDAFCAYAADRGARIDRTVVCLMSNGKRKTDADLIPLLAEYLGPDGPRLVLGPYLRELGLDPTALAPAPEDDARDLAQLALQIQAQAGALAGEVLAAMAPTSPGGLRVVGAEWAQLRPVAGELRELADRLERLAAVAVEGAA